MLFSLCHGERKRFREKSQLAYFTAQEDTQSLSWKVKSDGQAPGALASFYFCSISSNPKLIGNTQGRRHCTGHKPQEFQALRTRQGGFTQKIPGWASPKESGFTSRNKQCFLAFLPDHGF